MDRVHVMQLVRSFQVGQLGRREFLRRATLAMGSVAAANAVLAACAPAAEDAEPSPVVDESGEGGPEGTGTPDGSTSMTTPDSVSAERITYGTLGEQELTGYFAAPPGDGGPGVVLLQEWWGLNEHIEDVARRLAGEGYVVLAPDLYHGEVVTEPDEARKLVMELDTDNAVAEIGQAASFLLGQPMVEGARVGAVGFCMGGGLVLQAAKSVEELGAVVAFYGRPLAPDEAADVGAPVLGLYGAEDDGIPVAEVTAMEEALESAGVTNQFEIYEGAGHAFFNDTRESYAPEAADDAWTRMLAWFEEHIA